MKKHVLHIDKTYPRKLNGAVPTTNSIAGQNGDINWKFNTEADSIEGNISKEADPRPTEADDNDLESEDRIFEYDKLTTEQLASQQAAKQIRFNANVFDFKVHSVLTEVLLKYEAATLYQVTMGGEDHWISKIIQLKNRRYDYQLDFDLYIYDPIGIDAYTYEGYVRKQCFAKVLRDGTASSDKAKHDMAAYWTSPDTAVSSTVSVARTHDKYIYAGDDTKNTTIDELKFSIDKLPDMFDEDNKSFKIHLGLSGSGYATEDINSTAEQLTAFEDAMNNPASTEDSIRTAWEACDGIKYKFFDVAGNITYWVMPYLEIIPKTLEELYAYNKLKLDFVETTPQDLDLGMESEGKTKIRVVNPYHDLTEYPTIIGLDKDSIGKLYPNSRETVTINPYSKTNFLKIFKELVDNIDESGWVKAFAYINLFNFKGDLKFVADMVKNRTYVTGQLGEWIKECSDNFRKIELLPFVPQYLRENTSKKSEYTQFVLFTEKYLNRMFKAYDKNCYISVLEAIERIGQMNDPYEIYQNLVDKYDDDHGDMLHMTYAQLERLANIEKEDLNET